MKCVIQIRVLLAICIWIVYLTQHSYKKTIYCEGEAAKTTMRILS